MKLPEKIAIGLILLSFVVSALVFSSLPFQMATHWNFKGEIDGFMLKHFGAFFLPAMSLVIFVLLLLFIKSDPLIKGTKKFKVYPEWIFTIIVGFLTYLQMLILLINLGVIFNFVSALMIGLSLLFFFVGVLVKDTPRNYTVGFRTPWTLAEDKVWQKTHLFGAKLFKLLGFIILFGVIFPTQAIWILIIPIFLIVISIVVYSYLVHKNLKKKK